MGESAPVLAAYVQAVWEDPERRARALKAWWLASVGMLCVGYAVIALHYATWLHL
jgi:hypothetical protein